MSGYAVSGADAGYWLTKIVFQRMLALVYLTAFLVAANQFVGLLGERGLLPVPSLVKRVAFRESPSLFHFFPCDRAFKTAAWLGVLLSCAALFGLAERSTWLSIAVFAALWALYLSFVNVGQTFYAFGWETLLLEAGFLTIFSGATNTAPQILLIWMWRWVLFRTMFGAGLIKIRADRCWRDLRCLNYYFQTQPMPNPLSWYFHRLPRSVLKSGVVFNHFVELIVPFAYFAPQPAATIAGVLTIVFQGILMLSGNLSWLNFLTIVLAVSTLDGRLLHSVIRVPVPPVSTPALPLQAATWALAAVVVVLSIGPVRNLFSRVQLMNYSFTPLHLVNTYGAFGSITRTRYEIVIEGTSAEQITPSARWLEYEFKGKPGSVSRRPPQVAPYHLRLDWLMWFAAMPPWTVPAWFERLLVEILGGNKAVLKLLRRDPFPQGPPHFVRALLYEYHFTTPSERRIATVWSEPGFPAGRWWERQLIGLYFPVVSLTPKVPPDVSLHGSQEGRVA